MELFAWGAGYNLPSFDPFCLSIEVYLNLCQINWTLNVVSNPLISPSGDLPLLKIGGEPITGTGSIIKVLKLRGHDLDSLLSTNELCESMAFESLIEDKLNDALLYSWYLEDENYSKSTSTMLSKTASFLAKYSLSQKMKERVRNRLSNTRKHIDINGKLVPEIYIAARECYQALSDKLGDKEFFYGTRYQKLIGHRL